MSLGDAPSTIALSARVSARIVALALGLNVWAALVVIPAATQSVPAPWLWASAAVALIALIVGVVRRADVWLLAVFPALLIATVAAYPRLLGTQGLSPARFIVVAIGFVAYLLLAGPLVEFTPPLAPARLRAIDSERATSSRWSRRNRMYRWLTALTVLVPVGLVLTTLFDDRVRVLIIEAYPGRGDEMLTLFFVALLAAWLLIFRMSILALLQQHRTGDLATTQLLHGERVRVRAGQVPRSLYGWAALGLAVMAAYVLLLR